jgi:hypothetical protein
MSSKKILLQCRVAFLETLLDQGEATIDDCREREGLPEGFNLRRLGGVPTVLREAGVIAKVGYRLSARRIAHARPVTVWRLIDRRAAESWLKTYRELLAAETQPTSRRTAS